MKSPVPSLMFLVASTVCLLPVLANSQAASTPIDSFSGRHSMVGPPNRIARENRRGIETTATPLVFVPITPCRAYDTRQSQTPITGGSSEDFAIAGTCGIPAEAAAFSLNVTVVPQSFLGYLTIWPAGTSVPLVSTLNSYDGRIKANAAIVPAGSNGAISAFATDTTDLVIDTNGYFVATDAAGLAFYPLSAPCRVIDTRESNGALGSPSLSANSDRDFPILQSTCGIPSTAQAYLMNFTALPTSILSYLTVWPTGQDKPVVSTLNAPTGTVTANAAVVSAGADGSISTYVTDNTELVVDATGYFAPPGPDGQSLFTLTPCRVIDTRTTNDPFIGNLEPPVNVVASPCGLPTNLPIGAFVLNATVVPQSALGYLTLWPDGQPKPLASILNALDGAITNNMAIVTNQNGSLDAFAAGGTDLILDISSYFASVSMLSVAVDLPLGTVLSPYSGSVAASGGTPPYSYSISNGVLPLGLTLDSFSGLVTGTPLVPGTFPITIQATDALSHIGVVNETISINGN